MFMMSVRNTMKIRLAFVAALSLFAVCSFAANGTMKGEGTIESPFLVDDYEDLKMIGKGAYLYSSAYMLTADIDASASYGEWCSDGVCNGFIPLGLEKDAADASVFTGYFWGRGFTIRNMRIWTPCAHNVGFFANLGQGGLVSHLNFDSLVVWGGLDDIYAPHSKYVGAVAGTATGYILDVHVTKGEVQGLQYVGGIVGDMEKTTANLDNVSYEGVVRGGSSIGGLAGRSRGRIIDSNADVEIYAKGSDIGGLVGENKGDVEKSEAVGSILPLGNSISNVGGLVGYNISGGYITTSRASVDILPLTTGIPRSGLGGLVGDNYGTIEQSYATGNVIGKYGVGGLVGSSYGTIRNCFATGAVKGNRYVGGLVGDAVESVSTSYSVGPVEILDTTEVVDVGGLIGSGEADSSYWNVEFSGLDTSSGGTGLSDAAMKKFESFFGWSTEIWTIDEGESFPYLTAFGKKPDAVVYAIPTTAAKWQENPVVAAKDDTGRELFGKWTGANYLNAARDSIYYGYKIGHVKESDTVWSTSSYMAVPNRIEIATLEDLQKIGRHVGFPLFANYELTADIDASGVDFEPIGDERVLFTGGFDGKNHTISGFRIDGRKKDYSGLFGKAEKAVFRNIVFRNANVNGKKIVGVLAGRIDKSIVSNVVSYDATVNGHSNVGGLIGIAYTNVMDRLASTGAVTGDTCVGGLFGAFASKLTDAYSVNVVKGHYWVGGVMGGANLDFHNADTVLNVYSASLVKGPRKRIEGIAGSVEDSYYDEKYADIYFDSTLMPSEWQVDRYELGEALPTDSLLKRATFKGFDFESVWTIQEGVSYPYFKGMDPSLPGTLVDDGTSYALVGEGTAEKPFQITSYDDLKNVGKHEFGLDAHYELQGFYASESATDNCVDGVCAGFEPIGGTEGFSGTFTGHRDGIFKLTINRPDEDYVGLFTKLNPGAKVSGIGLGESTIIGRNYVGSIAGLDKGADLERVGAERDLVVRGNNYVGMVVGAKEGGSAKYNHVNGTVEGNDYVGSFAGSSKNASYTDNLSWASVQGNSNVGGFVGIDSASAYTNIYSISQVRGNENVGNLAGSSEKSTYKSVYYDGEVWQFDNSSVGKSLTTAEMLDSASYEGWEFGTVWLKHAADAYPILAWTDGVKLIYPVRTHDLKLKMEGSGTEEDPFLVKTYDDLKAIGYGKYKLSAVYRLANDIDASASSDELYYVDSASHPQLNFTIGFPSIGKYRENSKGLFGGSYEHGTDTTFTGKFHGNGHVIHDLYIATHQAYHNSGFFLAIDSSAIVDSLEIRFVEFSGVTAGLAYVNRGTVDNVNVKCDNLEADVGLVYRNEGSIRQSSFEGFFGGYGRFGPRGGGLVYINEGTISESYVNADVERDMPYVIAGFAVENHGTIENSFSMGDVLGMNDSAYSAVYLNTGVISKSYSVGKGYRAFAYENKGSIENSYALKTRYFVEQSDNGKPVDGTNYHTPQGTTMGSMYMQDEYRGFDFDSVWYIRDGFSTPMLRGLPNMPFPASVNLKIEGNESLEKRIRAKILDDAIVMDSTMTKVVHLDVTSVLLIDSLEKAENPSGMFDILYSVGMVLGKDTIWSDEAVARLGVLKSVGLRKVAVPSGSRFGAAFRGPHVALRFEIPAAGAVKFALVDMQGRVVYAADLGKRAAGAYSETLDADAIARGRYVGVLQVNGKVTEKVLVDRK